MSILTAYIIIGIILFALSQIVTAFGNAFQSKRFNIYDCAISFLLFGVFWFVGVGIIIWALTKKSS